MPLYSDAVDHNDGLVRKALGLLVGVAPMSADPLTTMLDAADGTLADFEAQGYTFLGRPSEDGVNFARETEVSEIFGHGSADPARSDIRRAVKRVSITLIESRKAIMEAAQGVTALGETVTQSSGSVEVTWDEPATPTYPYMRLIVVAQDISGTGELYVGRHALRSKVTEVGEEVWSDQDQSMSTPLTFTLFNDPAEGTPLRHFRGGPGYAEIVTDEGFSAPTP